MMSFCYFWVATNNLKSSVSEIRVKRIRVNQGVGVETRVKCIKRLAFAEKLA